MGRILIPAIAFLLLSCSDVGVAPQDRDFNILFRYGVDARNELNTFQNTYTKDLVLDGTITISLVLSVDELRAIEAKLVQAGFFEYPDTFAVKVKDSLFVAIDPHSTFYFRVKRGSTIKTLHWEDSVGPSLADSARERLQEVVVFISDLIGRKPEVLGLPLERGYYL